MTKGETERLISVLAKAGLPAAELRVSALRALRHRRCFVRARGIDMLTELDPPDLIDHLLFALRDRCWEVRIAAIEGLELALAGQGTAPPALIDRLGDPSHLVRVQAAEALGEIGDPRARKALRRGLEDVSPLVRRYVAEAIGRVGNSSDAQRLRRALRKETSPSARIGLTHGAYLLGEDWALAELLLFLRSSEYLDRSASGAALRDCAKSGQDRRVAMRALRRALAQETTPAREQMSKSLEVLQKATAARRKP